MPENPYEVESWTKAEEDILARYVTNTHLPVFAVINLPEVVKGALFARYSRASKSLRRLFLDEFAADITISSDGVTTGSEKAEALYDRVFFGYGDDSVAQLGGAHLACEQVSNLMTKVLERPRIGTSYLEQSTRYIAFDGRRDDGSWRYYQDPVLDGSSMSFKYRRDMDYIFSRYSTLLATMTSHFRSAIPCTDSDPGPWQQATRARALDTVRGLLPAASLSNLGIYASGQAYESLLMRMRTHPLPEVRTYSDMMLAELRKVIPSFLRRVDVDDRGGAWSSYLADRRQALDEVTARLFEPAETMTTTVSLIHWDPAAEDHLLAAAAYPHTNLPLAEIEDQVRRLDNSARSELLRAFVGPRQNRRHRPGRALEMPVYTFEILADYGAFRDLQRHRMLTIDWQKLSPEHGYAVPEAVIDAGLKRRYDEAMDRSAELYTALSAVGFEAQAQYAIGLGYRVRFQMTLNAREAMHLIELRSAPAGHPSYRFVAQEMHRLISDQAGHRAIAQMMNHVDYSATGLGRLGAEQKDAARQLKVA